VWTRTRDVNRLRSLLREFFPAALTAFPDLSTRSALRVLAAAPTPTAAAALSTEDLRTMLREVRVALPAARLRRLVAVFAVEQLHQPAQVEQAMGVAVQAMVRTVTATCDAVAELEDALTARFEHHPDAEILRSLPGLGPILGARVLGEFGDDRTRFPDAASRRRYAGTAPVTRASGKARIVIRRRARNNRLADACRWWAFAALSHSPGVRAAYDARRAAGDGHDAALRRIGSKLLGQLHHCLADQEPYQEQQAWTVIG
jgi:transposase